MLLEGRCAVVYGAGGAIGAAVAKAFAAEGARVFLTGPNIENLKPVMAEINGTGGNTEAGAVDAFDQEDVETHLNRLLDATGRLDISFNAVGLSYIIGDSLADRTVTDFVTSMDAAMRTQFVTATSAGRLMARAGSGVIETIIASPARSPIPNQGSLSVVGAATEALYRQLAMDLGPHGVRTVCLCSAGSPDAPGVDFAMNLSAESAGMPRQAFEDQLASRSALQRMPRLAEIGAAAALAASDHASSITGMLNVTCGQVWA